ncbi:FctA domain-containing protein, partial [Streptococcus timonensis]|uniref:Spy0128 family protein n=1 Tax=Streptococcus timonensis TaxID=1852387 RepID=UPI0039C48752
EAGEHEYVLTEKAGSVAGVEYSKESHTIHVSVVDNGEGKLVATVKEEDSTRKFTNKYKATPAEAVIKATKELVGKELAKEQFEFELSEGGNVIATSSNGKEVEGVEVATDEVAFKLSYTEAGDHEYTITEKAGSEEGVTYSTESYTIHVSVVDNGEGKLVATVKEEDSTRKFTNKYKATPAEAVIKATKELVGKELAKEQFEFELSEGGNVIATSSNGKEVEGVEVATNEVAFKLSYTEAGDHEYTITEKAGTAEGVTYSKESYTVHVKVVDNGEGKLVATVTEADEARKFTNTYTPTTEAPTTEAPTTEAPTTEAPTTEAPTTEAPTTEAPTTEAPTTEAPTTEAPTTEAPTTEAPTTEAPTTEAPTTEAPTTEAPTTEAPTTEAP